MRRNERLVRLLGGFALVLVAMAALAGVWELLLEALVWDEADQAGLVPGLHGGFESVLLVALLLLYAFWRRFARVLALVGGDGRRFDELAEHAADFVGMARRDGRMLYVNRRGLLLLGRGPNANIAAMSLADIHPPETARRLRREILPQAERDGVWSGESRLLLSDGRTIPVAQQIIAHRDARQRVSHYSVLISDITARKAADNWMRLTTGALGQAGDAIMITDTLAVIEYVNEAFVKLTGYERDEVIGRPASLLKSERMDAAFYRRLWITLEQGQVFRGEFINRRRDGSLYHEEKIITPVRDEAGRVTHFVSTGRDVTGRRALERRLRESNELLRRAQAVAHLGSGLWEVGGDRLLLSGEFFRILGQEARLFGSTLEDFLVCVHADDRQSLRSALARLLAEGEQLILDARIVRPGGEIRTLDLRMELERDGNDAPRSMVMIAHDVTERRRQEDNLLLWARALDASLSPVLITDATQADNPIMYVNAAFERVTGYSRDEAVGRNCRFLQGNDQDQGDLALLREAVRRGTEAHVVLRNYHKDGSLFWNELRVAPVRDEGGRLIHFIGVQNDITAQRAYEDQLLHQAHYDALTGLANRVLLQERLKLALVQAERGGKSVAVLFVDLDNFKLVNDSMGHELGDELLAMVARRLSSTLRREDTVARYGGDEFVVILADLAGQEAAERVADNLHRALTLPFDPRGEEVFVSASIGIALCPADGMTPEDLIRRADIALYRVKEQGGNDTGFYASELGEHVSERRNISKHLHGAVERGEFVLHYQPQLDLRNGAVTGVESLIRWRHPSLGLVPPDRFIPLAEENGEIVAIGAWVLREACAQGRAWLDAGSPLIVSVNLSARQFRQRDLGSTIATILDETGLPPHLLELELTETIVMQNAAMAADTLSELRQLGVRIAVDDFGTGYSSLAYLKHFPIDRLKIDRSFVRDVVTDADDAAIARAVVSLAHDLGLKVIAEGVEDESQLVFLRRSGCDEIQGYWLSPPLPAEQAIEVARRGAELPAAAMDGERVLLLVDDEPAILSSLKRLFRGENYRVLSAEDPQAALGLLARNPVGVVLSDYRMPGMDGVAFLLKVKSMYPRATRVILSGYSDLKTMRDAINDGAVYKYIAKPWNNDTLKAAVRDGFERAEREQENQRLYSELREAYGQLQDSRRWANATDAGGERDGCAPGLRPR